MELLKDFNINDIIVSADYAATAPKQWKQDKKQAYYEEHGTLPADIVINDSNVLIDGYTTYLTAARNGLQSIDVYRGWVEVIEAHHKAGGKFYRWRVPARLNGKISKGDKCIVRTLNGVRSVRVKEIFRQQYPVQNPRMKDVLKWCPSVYGNS